MLKPEYLEALPESMIVLMNDLEEWAIRDIVRRLKKSGITETARHQWEQISGFYDETELIAKTGEVSERAKALAGELFDKSEDTSFSWQKEAYASVGKTVAYDSVRILLQASKERMLDDVLNLTSTLGFAVQKNGKTVFQSIGQFYLATLNMAQMQLMVGIATPQSAIKQAVKAMANSGLRTVEYASGTSIRIDAAARRAIMTGVNQTTARMTDFLMREMGAEYVETTAHAGARPSHQTWQGKQFKVNGEAPGYPNFALATGYGTVTGLCGANCRHSYYPYFPGYSTPAYTRQQLANIDPPPFWYEGKRYTAYDATQMQRKFERNIRASRDRLIGYEEGGLTDDFMLESAKLKTLERGYKEFCKHAGLPTQNDRLQQLGFGKSVSAKAVWANLKYVEKYSGYRYNKDGTIIVTDDWKNKGHVSIPKKYRPYAVVQTVSGKAGQIDRIIYGKDGIMVKQIHSGNHGYPNRHRCGKNGEHVHDYIWEKDGTLKRTSRELSDAERKEHSDIV